MKRLLSAILLLLTFGIFSAFVVLNGKSKTVLEVLSPVKIVIDLDNNKTITQDEIICIEGIEAFSLDVTDDFYNKYSKKFNLSKSDMISLGFLAQDFTQKALENEKVSVNFTKKVTNDCQFANVTVKGINYKDKLKYSGFGIVNGEIAAPEKFKANLEQARKLNLVILNHYSMKYHTLDCPYGNAAHDKMILPENQLPADAKPCNVCHIQKEKSYKKVKHGKSAGDFKTPHVVQPLLAVNDGDLRVYYTDFTKNFVPNDRCDTSVCKEFVKLVDNAKSSIDIAIYGYGEIPAITSALKRAHQRGVNIRFVYDGNFNSSNDYYKDNAVIAQIASVSKSDKANSKALSNMIMHNKFVIFDCETIYTGSMNFSKTGLSAYDVNDVVIIKSKEIAKLYTKEFEQMLDGKFHTQKFKLNMPNKFLVGSSEVEVYFSPKDKQSKRIVELIKGAKNYIYVPTYLITHKQIADELINAKSRGVDVRVIIDANSTGITSSKHKILRENGILLKTENYAGKLHSKVMIIDDEYLITGSMNFSNSGESKNDENTLIIKNGKIAKAHKDFFLYLWTLIPNKYLKYNARPESLDSIGSCYDGVDNNFNGKIDKQEALCQ